MENPPNRAGGGIGLSATGNPGSSTVGLCLGDGDSWWQVGRPRRGPSAGFRRTTTAWDSPGGARAPKGCSSNRPRCCGRSSTSADAAPTDGADRLRGYGALPVGTRQPRRWTRSWAHLLVLDRHGAVMASRLVGLAVSGVHPSVLGYGLEVTCRRPARSGRSGIRARQQSPTYGRGTTRRAGLGGFGWHNRLRPRGGRPRQGPALASAGVAQPRPAAHRRRAPGRT